MNSYTLFELNEFIRRIVALNLPDALWVKAELAQVSHTRGHFFVDLVQKSTDEDQIIAQLAAVLWSRDHRRLKRQIGKTLDQVLQEGMQVMLQVQVDFHERYGLKLIIEDIDPSFTLGQLELKRRQNIELLRKKGLMEKNARLELPPVIQRIAVLSSEKAAGYQDYLKQLGSNPYGYSFKNTLFPSAVQGANVEGEIRFQLKNIEKLKSHFDCVVITRGGGARLDLMAFDHLALAQNIAEFPLPIITGIGHDTDETITDLVAHTALKTPTAVAEFFIQHNLAFESSMLEMGTQLQLSSIQFLKDQRYHLRELEKTLILYTGARLKNAGQMLEYIKAEVAQLARQNIRQERHKLEHLEQLSTLMSPEATLKRGFSITTKNSLIIKNGEQLEPGDELLTHLAEGQIKSVVIHSKQDEEKK